MIESHKISVLLLFFQKTDIYGYVGDKEMHLRIFTKNHNISFLWLSRRIEDDSWNILRDVKIGSIECFSSSSSSKMSPQRWVLIIFSLECPVNKW